MLRKLMKYEFQATARYFLPMYLLLLVLALVTRLTFSLAFMQTDNTFVKSFLVDMPSVVMGFAYGAGLLAVYVITLLIIVQRFYKNLLGDEGYLMFTLPVTPVQHLWSKILTAFVWCVGGILITILSFVVLFADNTFFVDLMDFLAALGEAMWKEAPHSWILLILLLVFLVTSLLHAILQIYGAIVLGCQAKKYRILAGIGVYLIFSMVEQFLISMAFTALFLIPDFPMGLIYLLGYPNETAEGVLFVVELMVGGMILYDLLLGGGYYILSRQMLKKRLNLE
ncbi:hypothetical protein [Anaeromassilibacillus sp. An200]|uniref:hypothetical protein n=1 Tax=Anaeromassilibacillus sp. An200 TaxID=1965587 RepID=UPI000B374C79|nr:hypothetical protein [Anaeromassilibacillus sp. An200]OUP12885.1 hypothetical protein B5F35_06370 [Anaeromassilibacillus sp. An200]